VQKTPGSIIDNIMIGLGGLLLVVSPVFAVPSFSFIGGVGKKVND
jgi:hypothetical protein